MNVWRMFFVVVHLMMSVCDASNIPITREKSIVSALVNPFHSSHSNHILQSTDPHNTQNISNFWISIEHLNVKLDQKFWRIALGIRYDGATISESVLFH